MLLGGLQICNVLESKEYSWDSNLPSSPCCVMGCGREMSLGTTESIMSDCQLLNKSLSLSPCHAWGFVLRTATPWTTRFDQEMQGIILEAVLPPPGTHPATAQGNTSVCTADTMVHRQNGLQLNFLWTWSSQPCRSSVTAMARQHWALAKLPCPGKTPTTAGLTPLQQKGK